MTKRTGVGLLAFGILLSFFVYFYATSTSPADISQDDATFLDAGLLNDPLDELLNEGEADIPIDDIETDDPALLNQQSAATVIAYSPDASQVGAVVAAGESGWRDDQEDKTYNKPPYGYAGNVRANGEATGWTYDPDEPNTAISVHAYIDGKARVGTFIGSTKADKNRSDITEGETSYNHWYSFSIPEEYKDGKTHTLYTYGIDAKGLSAKNNALLKNNPKSFNIPVGYVPPPFSQGDRVKATPNLYVRATPSTSGTKVGTVPPGSLGTIVGGPTKTESSTWWQINWDRKISGWSAQPYLAKATTPGTPSCTLTASPASITTGNSSTLSWTSTNATSGTINQGVGAMTPITSGTKSVSPPSSTLYTATVTGTGGQATCSARVGVGVTPPPSTDVITVQGNKILRNGQPFIMKGVVFESSQYTDADLAFCSSPGHTDEVSCKKMKDSRDYYFARGAFASGNDVFSVLPQWGANTIRLNLGQALLDPQSPYYDAAYVQMVVDSVKRARDRGYVVIVSPFAGRNDRAGVYLNSHNPDTPLDSASTLSANETLAGLFKNDRGVIFETLNEPYWTHNAAGWGYWMNGGTNVGPNGWNFVVVNAVISAVRATGARNVIIAQGIGASFEGFPGGVIDSAGQLAYSAHPFLNKGPYESDWQARFGTFAATHPFLITAWGSK